MKRLTNFIGLLAVLVTMSTTLSAQKLFTVDVKGKGKPVLLIPGLYCSGAVWNETVARYQKDYECHVLTLAGFGGNPPALKDNFLEAVKTEIISYVRAKRLARPIIVGHSLGGFLAYWAASSAPELFSGVISVDGLPFLPEIQKAGSTVESSKPMAVNMKNYMGSQTPEGTLAAQKMYLPMMIRDSARIAQVARMATKSDAKTMGEVMYELYTTDLRPEVHKITCPVLMLGAWIAYKDYGATHDTAVASYSAQVATIAHCKVEISDTALHFIFYDEPTWFYSNVDSFLKSL